MKVFGGVSECVVGLKYYFDNQSKIDEKNKCIGVHPISTEIKMLLLFSTNLLVYIFKSALYPNYF